MTGVWSGVPGCAWTQRPAPGGWDTGSGGAIGVRDWRPRQPDGCRAGRLPTYRWNRSRHTVAVDNPASAAVLRRIGFKEAGAGRERFLARGGEIDVVRFAAQREELFGKLEAVEPEDAQPGRTAPNTLAASAEPAKPLLLVAACALVDSDGRVLLARRPEGKPMAGLWEFPGGKIATGESPEAAVIRELARGAGHRHREKLLGRFPRSPATRMRGSTC